MNEAGNQGAAHSGRPFGRSADPPIGWALISRAVMDYLAGDEEAALIIISDADEARVLPAAHFFRSLPEMPGAEQEALRLAQGTVLDIGAGAGAHALALQEAGVRVTATEVSEDAVSVLRGRGVTDARVEDVFSEPGPERWDTVLLLMNGTTLVGSAAGLSRLLEAAAARMAAGGCILIDSTDLTGDDPASEDEDPSETEVDDSREGQYDDADPYVGEVQLQVEYLDVKSQPFPVLYAHPELLRECAEAVGLHAEVVYEGGAGSYLARVTRG